MHYSFRMNMFVQNFHQQGGMEKYKSVQFALMIHISSHCRLGKKWQWAEYLMTLSCPLCTTASGGWENDINEQKVFTRSPFGKQDFLCKGHYNELLLDCSSSFSRLTLWPFLNSCFSSSFHLLNSAGWSMNLIPLVLGGSSASPYLSFTVKLLFS